MRYIVEYVEQRFKTVVVETKLTDPVKIANAVIGGRLKVTEKPSFAAGFPQPGSEVYVRRESDRFRGLQVARVNETAE